MKARPTAYELRLADALGSATTPEERVELLVELREKLLHPFDDLQRDYRALGDVRVAADLDDLLLTARGRE